MAQRSSGMQFTKKIDAAELQSIENRMIHAVSRAISFQEQAIASFESSREKPERLTKEIVSIRWYNSELSAWLREFLLLKSKSPSPEQVFAMIDKLQGITKSYGDM